MGRYDTSHKLFAQAVDLMPGGVNSPVRSFRSVGREPVFIKRADGAFVFDADGNRYIDYVCSWGPAILGHNHPAIREAVRAALENGLSFGAATEAEVVMARMMREAVPSLEMLRMVNSGTEAVMSALRTARGFTGRAKVVKFAGCYHGHADAMLVKAGSGLLSGASALNGAIPDSAGVSEAVAADTLVARYNSLESVTALFERFGSGIAAVIVEPVAANMGVVPPDSLFLEGLRSICTEYGALLIFDEVITGFRLSFGGAQELFDIRPDLSCFGKIIGAGLPVGAYGGRRDVMDTVAPVGPVYQAGTLSGNPVAMAAGISQLGYLRDHKEVYTRLAALGERLFGGLAAAAGAQGVMNSIGSIGSLFFNNAPVKDAETALSSDTKRYADYFGYMLDRGVYLAPAQFEAMFISASHTEADIDRTIEAVSGFFAARSAAISN